MSPTLFAGQNPNFSANDGNLRVGPAVSIEFLEIHPPDRDMKARSPASGEYDNTLLPRGEGLPKLIYRAI